MKKTLLLGIVLVILCSGCVMQSGSSALQAAPEGFVKLAITGTDVNLRPLPHAGGTVITQASTGDVFIAEQWPIDNTTEKSQWYRIVFAIKDNGDIVPLPSVDKRFKAGFFPFVSAAFTEISPITWEQDTQARALPYRQGFRYDLGNSLPDIVRRFGPGEITRKFDLEGIEYYGIGNLISTIVSLPGLEGLLFEGLDEPYDINGKSFTLSRPGVVFRGVAIATPGFGKEEVRALMKAEFRNMQPNITTQEDGEHWGYNAEMWDCEFVFDERGLVVRYQFYYTTG